MSKPQSRGKSLAVVLGALLASAAGCASAPQFQLVGTIHEIMEGAIEPLAFIVWDSVSTVVDAEGVHENFPRSDEDWEYVEHAAIGLAETANLLVMEGRARDRAWVEFTHDLTRTALTARDAAQARDTEALLEAGGRIYEACTACHRAYIVE